MAIHIALRQPLQCVVAVDIGAAAGRIEIRQGAVAGSIRVGIGAAVIQHPVPGRAHLVIMSCYAVCIIIGRVIGLDGGSIVFLRHPRQSVQVVLL